MSKEPKHGLKIRENKGLKALWLDNKNHKRLWDNTDHRSVNQHTYLRSPSILIAYNISQHTGVYNPFQITLFTKSVKKTIPRKAMKQRGN